MVKEKLKPSGKPLETPPENRELILFNDDVNTFEHVIESLIEVCNHDALQAEQCALIAHYNGRCGIMTGSLEELKTASDEMTDRELTVKII